MKIIYILLLLLITCKGQETQKLVDEIVRTAQLHNSQGQPVTVNLHFYDNIEDQRYYTNIKGDDGQDGQQGGKNGNFQGSNRNNGIKTNGMNRKNNINNNIRQYKATRPLGINHYRINSINGNKVNIQATVDQSTITFNYYGKMHFAYFINNFNRIKIISKWTRLNLPFQPHPSQGQINNAFVSSSFYDFNGDSFILKDNVGNILVQFSRID